MKFKVCCLGGSANSDAGPNQATDSAVNAVNVALQAALAEKQFESIEEVQALADRVMLEQNSRAMDDFDGLNPAQMQSLLYEHAPDNGSFFLHRNPDDVSGVPVMELLGMLLDAIGDKGLKPTATGNLPRKVCREIAERHLGPAGYAHHTRFGGINSEPDFQPLHITRLTAELAGLTRKYKGKIIASKRARDLYESEGIAGLFPDMLQAFTEQYNWAYTDRFPDLPFIRQSWRFTAWLLYRHGSVEQSAEFYADKYAKAFPMLIDECALDEDGWLLDEPLDSLKRAYCWRTLVHFGEFFGLLERRVLKPQKPLSDYVVKSGPLMACFEFKL